MLSAHIRPTRLVSFAAVLLFAAAPLAARAADACSLLSKEQIGAVANDTITNASGMATTCIWSGKNTTAYLGIRDDAWSTAKGGAQKYGAYEAAPGVGSDAFFTPANDPHPTLFAFKGGGHFITIRLNVKGFSAEQTKAGLKTLANEALGKF